MKKMSKVFLILFLLFGKMTYSQSTQIDERKNYIEEINKQTFTSLGNNDLMYYECSNDCIDLVVNISEKYWKGIKTTKKQKQELGNSLLEQYTYLFYSKGFKTLTIKIEGIEPIKKDLKFVYIKKIK
jgi:hypothetical protein